MSVWYFMLDGEATGPLTASRLVEFCRLGVIDEDTLIWREGEAQWKPFNEIFGSVALKPPPLTNHALRKDDEKLEIEKNKYRDRGIAALVILLIIIFVFILFQSTNTRFAQKGKEICLSIRSDKILDYWRERVITKFDDHYIWVGEKNWNFVSYDTKISIALAHFCKVHPEGAGFTAVRGAQSGEWLATVSDGNFFRE